MPSEPPSFRAILDTLARLHDHKTVGYGDAWRKRGELLSIFTNLARKYDRLTVALDERILSEDEPLLDTAADLCVYSAKYLSWLADVHPREFGAASNGASAQACSDSAGPDALREIFSHVNAMDTVESIDGSWARVKEVFVPLEAGLMAQAGANGATMLSWEEKTRLAWALAEGAAQLALVISTARPEEWAALQSDIAAMDLRR